MQDISSSVRISLSLIEEIRSFPEYETGDKEFYRSMIQQIIVHDYGYLEVHLNGLPMAFDIEFSIRKANFAGVFDISIDKCEIKSA